MHIKCKEQVHSALAWGTERTRSFFFDCTPFRKTCSYIPQPVCEGKPFCAIEIKVEPLSHLIFHKTLLHMIPTAKLISQANIHGSCWQSSRRFGWWHSYRAFNGDAVYWLLFDSLVLSDLSLCLLSGNALAVQMCIRLSAVLSFPMPVLDWQFSYDRRSTSS